MALSPQAIAEARKVYETFWDSYLTGNIEAFTACIDEAFSIIGTSEGEISFGKEAVAAMYEAQFDEVVGKAEGRNRQVREIPTGDMLQIIEFSDIYVLIDSEWSFYSKFRLSTLLHQTTDGWKLLQQHGSLPDMRVGEGETVAIDKISKENLELRDAVKRRTAELESKNRELEIEASLERVRAVAMGMNKPEDMLVVCREIAAQLQLFGVDRIRNVQTAIIDAEIGQYLCYQYFAPYDRDVIEITEYLKSTLEHELVKQMMASQDAYFINSLSGNELDTYSAHRKAENYLPDPLLDEAKEVHYCFLSIGEGGLGLTLYKAFDEEILNLFKRFHQVFSLAYQRFRDIQKAEAQAKEAKIETALEKVRSRSLAMQKSDELQEVIQVVYEQFAQLDMEVDHTGFIIDYPTNEDMHIWLADRNGVPSEIRIPYFDSPHWNSFVEAKKKGTDFFVNHHSFEEKNTFYHTLFELIPGLSDETKTYYLECPGLDISTVLMDNVGLYIERFSGTPYTDADNQTLKRFGKVFQQAYTRFLDLQKAEKQALEAQIETALEKVRSRSLAMRSSDELNEVVKVLFEKMTELQVPSTAIGIQTFPEGSKDMQCFVCGDVGNGMVINQYLLPYFDHPILNDYIESHRKGLDYFVGTYSKELKDSLYEVVLELPELKNIPVEVKAMILESKFYEITMVPAKKSTLAVNDFIGNPLSESQIAILKRFTKVFDQAYLRFLDLQKAEDQAREAQIEAGLERVRSASMAMHSTSELRKVISAVFGQLKDLHLPLDACYIDIFEPDNWGLNIWVGTETDTYPEKLIVSYLDHPLFIKTKEARLQHKSFFSLKNDKESKNRLVSHLVSENERVRERLGLMLPLDSLDMSVALSEHAALSVYNYRGITYSEAQNEIIKRFSIVFQQAYTRFLDIQKAEAQAHEAQIELALERIRAQVTAMQESSDLLDIVVTMRAEFVKLGHEAHYFWHMRWLPETYAKAMTSGDGTKIGMVMSLPRRIHGDIKAVADWEKGCEPVHVLAMDAETAVDYIHKMVTWGDFERVDPQAPTLDDIRHIGGLTFVMARTTHGEIGYSLPGEVPDPPKDAVDTLVRFAGVFDLAYKRFEDLKATERQTREARIELALEKVRSRTMGMQRSDELADVANVLFAEMNGLVHNLWTCGFVLCERDRAEDEWWLSLEDGFSRGFFLPNVNDYAHATLYEGWLEGDAFRTVQLDGGKLQEHYDWLMQIPVAKNIFDEMEAAGMQRPEWQKLHAAYFSKGYLVIITREPCPEEEIFKRFAIVFDQTYTRFLDLKKAEAQAREAQIEAALEKVRSRSLAMQTPDELIDVVQLLREEMGALGVEELETSSIYIHDESSGNAQCWFTIKDSASGKTVTDQMTLNLQDTWVGKEMLSFYRSDMKQTSILMQGAQRVEWIRYCGEKSNAFTPEGFYGDAIPERTYHLYKFSEGFIGAASPGEISSESWDLLKRATSVFSFAYTRFRDLQKAETRAREARIELALERIRAQVASMQESSDLFDIVVGMRTEFLALGHEADYFWHMRWLPESYEMSMTSEDGSRIGMVISLPKFVHDEIPALAEWEKGNDPIYVLALDPVGAWNYIENMNTHGSYELADPNAPGKEDIAHIGGLTFIMARTTHGEIGYGLPGMVPDPPKDALDTLVRFAGVFDLAYRRFEDLKAAEHQALMIREERDRLEIALNELRATQAQLVQQEKLASLGQLTAGIAHEIKNPLNFVNNFSEVSLELIDEALEELSAVKAQCTASPELPNASPGMESFNDIQEILADVQSNLTKIHQHGSRANGIVSSMLQHSRGGSGKPEPTDLNALVKEYVNLAFHGMRAGKSPINVDIQLDLDESLGKVNLIGEDFSRVVLNMANNAFDAMREKAKTASAYTPQLMVRTKRSATGVEISVTDNGPGIPDEIKDKILQPFFTTKKGTEGTGLGLSITHDIIKAHGGELTLESVEGKATLFKIYLPTT